MKNISILRSLIYGNKAIVICVTFTIATMLDLLLCVPLGITDISYWHLGYRFFLCAIIVLSLYLFRFLEKLPLYAMLIIHFAISIAIMLGCVWVQITVLSRELHPNAYRDAARTIIIIYPVIIIGCIVIDVIRTAKANRILKSRFSKTNDK